MKVGDTILIKATVVELYEDSVNVKVDIVGHEGCTIFMPDDSLFTADEKSVVPVVVHTPVVEVTKPQVTEVKPLETKPNDSNPETKNE